MKCRSTGGIRPLNLRLTRKEFGSRVSSSETSRSGCE
jgi:hypothetical protein